MQKLIKVNNFFIGEGHPCFIIAEAGSNHNGDYKQALQLIDVAVEAKADAVKFQTFKASKLYSSKAGKSGYLKSEKSIYDIIKEMEMPTEWISKLAEYCKQKGIIFLSSPFDEESVDLLDPYIPLYKIASYELTHFPLLEYAAQKGKPIILSTGTANMEEVEQAVHVIKKAGNNQLILMQCTASYPTSLSAINAKSILALKNKFKIPVGLSDHSRECDVAPMTAVALGADCIEKHFTLDNSLTGPDHKFSIEPEELKIMVQKIRQVEQSLGREEKVLLEEEKELYQFARRSIFAVQNINEGDILTKENTAVLRNGVLQPGITPDKYDFIVGKSVRKKIEEGQPIQQEDIV